MKAKRVRKSVNSVSKIVINSLVRRLLTQNPPLIHTVIDTVNSAVMRQRMSARAWNHWLHVQRCLFYGYHEALKWPLGTLGMPLASSAMAKARRLFFIKVGMECALKQRVHFNSIKRAN